MMKCKLTLAMLAGFSGMAVAQPIVIGDYDGYQRRTEHASGPVLSWQTDTIAARQLRVYQHRQAGSQCQVHAVYSEQGQQYLAPVRQSALSERVDLLEAELPDAALSQHKILLADCQDERGQQYQVQHKIPALPQLQWHAGLTPAGRFVRQPRGYDYHDAVQIHSRLLVNNFSTDAYCQSETTSGYAQLPLFHGKSGHGPFQEDVFVANLQISNNKPVLQQQLICQNPAGTSRLIRVWELYHEHEIRLVHNELIYQ